MKKGNASWRELIDRVYLSMWLAAYLCVELEPQLCVDI